MKVVLNIIAVITGVLYSLIMLFNAFFLSAPLFGVAPTPGEVVGSIVISLVAITVIVLSCFIPKYKHMQVIVLGVIVIFSLFQIFDGSPDYPVILSVYLLINIPIVIYRYIRR